MSVPVQRGDGLQRVTSQPNAARLNVTGLLLTAAGMLVERAAGSELYPTLAGPVVLLAGAAAVATRPGGWTRAAGLIIPVVLTAGLVASVVLSPAFSEQLVEVGNGSLFAGSLLHVVGLVAAVAGGLGVVLNRDGDASTVAGGSR